jgi:H/ACA ribonucleoprotein complex subunit 4
MVGKTGIRSGIIVLDKPQGPSSHQVTAWVSKMLDLPAGHSGTLDPMVSGVLVIMLGKAVRLAPVLLKEEKEYVALMRLHGDVNRQKIEEIAQEFTGRIYQRPPRKSAVRRALRIRTIHELEILEVKGRLVLFRVRCESGTYIRSLCHHMGLALGAGGHMQELRRIRSGIFSEGGACTLHDVMDACTAAEEGNPSALHSLVIPIDQALGDVPGIVIRDLAVDAVCHGAVLAGVGVVGREPHGKGDLVAVFTQNKELVCLGEALKSSNEYEPGDTGLVVAPRAVLMSPDTYPRGWKKQAKNTVQRNA